MKNYDHKLKLLSLINEKILNRSTEERYRLMHAASSKPKKRWVIPMAALSVAAVLLLSVVTVLLIPLLSKQIPVYTGMTVSSATENDVLDSGAGECRPVNVSYRFEASELPSVFKDPTKPGGEGEHTKEHENQKDPFGEIQASEDMYVARSGETIRITIHFDNPEQYEILSFTINGIKYGSHMFLEGSDMEDLTVEYTVPEDAEGVLECTIDAIKYIDGTKIKDVKIGGDQTVQILVYRVYSITYKIGDEEFKTWTITNVATHYRYTGRGYMQSIFKKVFEDSIFLSDLTKINGGVEVNRTEHVVKLRAVVLFNIGKSDIDLLTDGGIVSIFVEVIKCRGLVHNKALTAHGTCNSFFVAVVLLAVLLSCICVNIAQILYKKHREDVVLVARAINFSAEAVTCIPEYLFNVLLGCHFMLPRFFMLS